MKFTQLLSSLIVEDSRTQFLHDKYVQDPTGTEKRKKNTIPLKYFKEIIQADPTTKAPEGFDFENATYDDIKDKVNAGGFTEWIIKSLFKLKPTDTTLQPGTPAFSNEMKEKVRVFMEDLFKVKEDLAKFARLKQYFPQEKRDINKFSSPDELFKFITDFKLPEKKQKELEKKQLKKEIRSEREGYRHPGAQIVFTGDKFTVVKIEGTSPQAQEAASWYGGFYDYANGESRWCTSPPNSNYFRTYASQGPLYVILANDDNGKVGQRTGLPQERYQWHFESNQFMDRADHQIDLVKFLTGEGAELKEYFKPMFMSGGGGETNTNRIDLKLSSPRGKIMAIYGFDKLFDGLSPDLVGLQIINDTKADIAIDIPESIGNLKKLQSLNLNGLVKSLPESIGGLDNLWALSLSNNPHLKTVPVSVVNMQSLVFVNLQNCNPNIDLPQEFLDNFTNADSNIWYKNGEV